MGSAYTPGLTISRGMRVKKIRRLPLKGVTLASIGDRVVPETVVARAELAGILQTARVAEELGLEPKEAIKALNIKVGDQVERGEVIAETRSLFGLLKSEVKAPVSGRVEFIAEQTGHVGIRQAPTPIEVHAYISGVVTEIIDQEGVVVETDAAMVQGIFGVGGERTGELMMAAEGPGAPLKVPENVDLSGRILAGGGIVSLESLLKAASLGVVGVIVGGIVDTDLVEFVGHEIGVAITGQEDIPLTLILTEGFGPVRMAEKTFSILKEFEGRKASINGATQIRAGVIRPEVIVPNEMAPTISQAKTEESLDIGTEIRIIREPYFGLLAVVESLPPEPVIIPSGSTTRVLTARLENGEVVTVPRANVEIVQG